MGARLLVFKNKSDIAGGMDEADIIEVCRLLCPGTHELTLTGLTPRLDTNAQMEYHELQCYDWIEPEARTGMGSTGRQRPSVFILIHQSYFNLPAWRHLGLGNDVHLAAHL